MAVAIIGNLDEREGAIDIVKNEIERRGHETILINMSLGVGAVAPSPRGDVRGEEILRLAGATVEEVKGLFVVNREKALTVMAEGLTKKLLELHKNGELEGVIAIAGMTGTYLSLIAMNALPFGVPKLMISSVVAMPAYASWLAEYIWRRDITVLNAVVDLVGMNRAVREIAENGGNAIAGMVEKGRGPPEVGKPSLVLTEFAFCDEGAHYVRQTLEEDYELVSFHAQGLGDKTAVDLVNQGVFVGFIDLAPSGFSEYLLGGNRASGPNRLDAAMHLPIPYILAPCGFDMISCGPIQRKDKDDDLWVSRKLAARKMFLQDAVRVQVRTSPEEMHEIGHAVAERLNMHEYKKMIKFVIPRRGFSSLSVEGGALYDPDSDEAFIAALKRDLDPEIEVLELDTHINTREFAKAIAEVLAKALNTNRD